jgi:two-component system, OmpR family, phosphate regulon response regulator PhoB
MTNVASIRDFLGPSQDTARVGVPLVPIVMILAQGDDMDSQLRELARRIEGMLSRPDGPDRPAVLEAGELLIDLRAHRVTVAGEVVRLTGLEYKLLVKLAGRKDAVQARGDLLREVWELSALNRTRTVDTHVKRLRDKLKSAGRFIQTVRGIGYRFSEAPAEDADPRDALDGHIPHMKVATDV